MFRISKTILILFLCNCLYAQNYFGLKGNVSSTESIVTVGDVLLISPNDGKLITYTTIDQGIFYFNNIKRGTYILKINSLGYKEFKKTIKLNTDIELNAELTESTTALEEIEITAIKQPIENKNGNIIVNVENTIFSTESNPIDLLSKLPKIQISNNRESISVFGKGTALIYLGNQKISVQELQNIPIEDIKTIEIISHPSSKYEAEGRSVILITSKVSKKNGFKGSISETASFRKNFNNYLSANASVKHNKIEYKLNAEFNDLHPWESNESAYTIVDKDIESEYLAVVDDTKRPQFIVGGGLHYQINTDDYFSISTTLRSQKDAFVIETFTTNNQNNIEDKIFTLNDNDDFRFFSSTNLNYSKAFDKKTNMFIGLQYSFYNKERGSAIANNFNATGLVSNQSRFQDFKVNVLSLKTDLEKKIANKMKLELGTSVTITNAITDTEISIINSATNTMTNYDYKENNYAGYSQLSGKIGKFSFVTGARVETMNGKGGLNNKDTLLVNRKNIKLFPKAMLNYEIDSTKNLTLNYTKSILRPNFTSISTASTYLNPFLEGSNTVELKSVIIDELSLNYEFKKYSISANYALKENPVFYSITYNDILEISTMKPINFDKEERFSIELAIPIKYKFWNSSTYIDFVSKRVSDKNAIVFKATPYLYIYSNHQFMIDNTFSASITGWGYTKHNLGVHKRIGAFAVNASLTKKFFKKLGATLNFNDIFKSIRFEESYDVNNVKVNTTFYNDINDFSISFKYNFGKLKESKFKNKDVDENLNRIN